MGADISSREHPPPQPEQKSTACTFTNNITTNKQMSDNSVKTDRILFVILTILSVVLIVTMSIVKLTTPKQMTVENHCIYSGS